MIEISRAQIRRTEWTMQVIRCGCGNPKVHHRSGWYARLMGQPKYLPCPTPLRQSPITTFTARCYDCGDPDGRHEDGTPYHVDRECRLEGTSNREVS